MTTKNKSAFEASLEAYLFEDTLKSVRMKAWKKFQERGLPHPKEDAYRYFKPTTLYQKNVSKQLFEVPNIEKIKQWTDPFKDKNYLLFYQGHFLPKYSQYADLENYIEILPLSEAFSTYGAFFRTYFDEFLKKEKDPLTLLSLALHQEGLFVYIPKNTQCEKELIILEVSEINGSLWQAPFSVVSVGKNSACQITTVSLGESTIDQQVTSPFYGFDLGELSKLSHTHSSLYQKGVRMDSFRVRQQRESHFKHVNVQVGSSKVRSSYQVELQGEHVQSEILGLNVLKGKEEAHTHILMEHLAPNGLSRQLIKNLVDEQSTSSFEGKIYIESLAQLTNAYQTNHNCVLSDEASAYSKPNLEIYADDVKASHGSTTGQIDKEQLFYLQSRGLTSSQAKQILLKGFCDEILESIPSHLIKTQLAKELEKYFEGK
ncbi:MAG: hypothetical protein S4CHLAM7_01370 [Chlamydiae bacterium]|nr:hypothetical protein [Chlamydiota bacterium]